MERSRKTRMIVLGAIIVAVAAMSIGFAAMSTTLNIQGTADFNPATWNIRFQNLSGPSITGSAVELTAPTISGTGNTIISTYNVQLTRPGDKVVYTFDISNLGTIDAMLTSFSMPRPLCSGTGDTAIADAQLICNNLVYTLRYTSGSAAVGVDDALNAGISRNVTLTIEYPLTMVSLPENSVHVTAMNISIGYTQV